MQPTSNSFIRPPSPISSMDLNPQDRLPPGLFLRALSPFDEPMSPDRDFSVETMSSLIFSSLGKRPPPPSLSFFQSPPKTPRRTTFNKGKDPFASKVLDYIYKNRITKKGLEFPLERRPLQGQHSEVKFFLNTTPQFCEEASNDQLVVKLFKEDSFDKHGRIVELELFPYSIKQYKQLCDDFKDLPEEKKPFTRIYNIETVCDDAYIVQEKITPFSAPLWDRDSKAEELNEEQISVLNQIKTLFHYSFLLQGKPGLDLKWANIGLRNDSSTLVIFDYYEYEDDFFIIAKHALEDLSVRSPSIYSYILDGLLEKCEHNQTLKDSYHRLMSYKSEM